MTATKPTSSSSSPLPNQPNPTPVLSPAADASVPPNSIASPAMRNAFSSPGKLRALAPLCQLSTPPTPNSTCWHTDWAMQRGGAVASSRPPKRREAQTPLRAISWDWSSCTRVGFRGV